MGKFYKKIRHFFQEHEFISIAILFALILIFFFGKSFFDSFRHGDFIAYWVPNYAYILKSLHNGQVPLWQPNILLGIPELFKSELAIFSPAVLVTLTINFFFNANINLNFLGKSFELLQIIYLFLSMFGTYYLLRKQLRLVIFPSFLGGMLYGLTLFTTSHFGNLSTLPGIALFPILISINLLFIKSTTFKNYIFLVLINAVLLSFGYPYNSFYFFLAQIILGLCFGLRYFFLICLTLLNSLALSAAFLLPNFYIYNQSFRGVISTIDDPLFHLYHAYIPTKIVTILNPQIFDSYISLNDPQSLFSRKILSWGVFSIPFLILGFYSYKFSRFNLWLIIIFILGLMISIGGYINFPETAGIVFPFLDKFRSHWQALTLPIFAGIIFISQGAHALIIKKLDKKIFFILWQILILTFIATLTMPYLCSGGVTCSSGNFDIVVSFSRAIILFFFSLLLINLFRKTNKQIFLFIGLVILIFELRFYYHNIPHFHMETSYENYYELNSLIPEKPTKDNLFRYYFARNQFAYNASFMDVPSTSGYDSIPYPASQKTSRFEKIQELQFTNTKYLVTIDQENENSSLLKLIKTISPSDHPHETFMSYTPGIPYRIPNSGNNHYIYEVVNYLPRFFVPYRVISCMKNNCGVPESPPQVVYVSNHEGIDSEQNPEDTDITINAYDSSRIVLTIQSKKDAIIASSEILDDGWEIEINGKKSSFYNVSDGFRGFKVSRGNNHVIMRYSQPYLTIGIIVSSVTAVILLFAFILKRKIR